jgi:hypothetical protein
MQLKLRFDVKRKVGKRPPPSGKNKGRPFFETHVSADTSTTPCSLQALDARHFVFRLLHRNTS